MRESGDEDSASSSDEEYVPPSKSRKRDDGSDSSSGSESDYSEDDDDDDNSKSENGVTCPGGETNNVCKPADDDNESKKQKEDKIWDEFLNSTESPPKQITDEPSTIVKRYQFAGEEIEVTEKVKAPSQNSLKPVISTSQNGKANSTIVTTTPKIAAAKSNLSSALNNLKSLATGKAPKLSTLEKSRLDWENFVKNEDIEHDLKSHNKSKDAYLERQAFVSRASEREYQYKRNLESTSNRRKP